MGLQYSSVNGTLAWAYYRLPAPTQSISVGMAYKTGKGARWREGPHFLGFASDAAGDLNRLADESNSADGLREIRISPADNTNHAARVLIADNTWYWVAFQQTATATRLNVYDSSLILVGSANFTGGGTVNTVFFGNDLSEAIPTVTCLDNLMIDPTGMAFPILPGVAPPPPPPPPTPPPSVKPGSYLTVNGSTAVVSSQLTGTNDWIGTLTVNSLLVPSYWDANGISSVNGFTLVLQ